MTRLMPRQPLPTLEIATVDGPVWRLADQTPEPFTLIVFYRGLHCPICKGYLRALDQKLRQFQALGTTVIAISSDSMERAREAKQSWEIGALPIGYGFDLEAARHWGLYLSAARNDREPARFIEPGLFLIRADGTLYFGSVQTMPFARPKLDDILQALDFVIKNDYPARGELAA